MKKLLIFVLSLSLFAIPSIVPANELGHQSRFNHTNDDIPEIDVASTYGFQKIADVTQHKEADWSNVVGIARRVSLIDACKIAEANPEITYFFYTKGIVMALEKPEGGYRIFLHGDTVFFTGQPSWGSAPGLADGYIKN